MVSVDCTYMRSSTRPWRCRRDGRDRMSDIRLEGVTSATVRCSGRHVDLTWLKASSSHPGASARQDDALSLIAASTGDPPHLHRRRDITDATAQERNIVWFSSPTAVSAHDGAENVLFRSASAGSPAPGARAGDGARRWCSWRPQIAAHPSFGRPAAGGAWRAISSARSCCRRHSGALDASWRGAQVS